MQQSSVEGELPAFILTGHHQADQAETFLLQLARGAGAKGLSAMGIFDAERRLLRPLLTASQASIIAYASAHGLDWCEDESNLNTDFDRNFIRHEVLPVLQSRYPDIAQLISRSAHHIAQAQQLNDALAEIDAKDMVKGKQIDLVLLRHLPLARVNNVLRWWLAKHGLRMPNARQLAQMTQQLLYAKEGADVELVHSGHRILIYENTAYLIKLIDEAILGDYSFTWQGEAQVMLPNGDEVIFEEKMGEGLRLQKSAKLSIDKRQGGGRLKIQADRPTKSLKQLFQEAKVPPWEREFYPLIYQNLQLVYMPSIGCAVDHQASENEMGLVITLLKKS